MKFIYVNGIFNKGYVFGKVRWKTKEHYYGILTGHLGRTYNFDTVSVIYNDTIEIAKLENRYVPEDKLPVEVMKMIVDPFFEIDLGKWLTKNDLEICEIL